jgi:hypothetical protein
MNNLDDDIVFVSSVTRISIPAGLDVVIASVKSEANGADML